MTVTTPDEAARELLRAVRSLGPKELLRLAALWAGVADGVIDSRRQRRRNAARVAVRFAAGEDASRATTSNLAAEAVAAAFASSDPRSIRTLHGPAADATWAVVDALDAIDNAARLTRMAYDELLLPWRQLMEERWGEGWSDGKPEIDT